MSNYIEFSFENYPARDAHGRVDHFKGLARIQRVASSYALDDRPPIAGRDMPPPHTNWVVLEIKAVGRKYQCAIGEDQEHDLERWLKGKVKLRDEIEALLAAAAEAEGLR